MASNRSFSVKIPTAIPNLYLRTPQPTDHDAKALSEMFGHKFNSRFEPERPGSKEPTPDLYMERIPAWLEMAEKGQNCFCLIALGSEEASEEDEIIGFGGLNELITKPTSDGEGKMKFANIGVMLHEPYTGKGYAMAALHATIEACFERFGVDVVEADTFAINEPFRGLMKKLKLEQYSKVVSEEGPGEVLYSFNKSQWNGCPMRNCLLVKAFQRSISKKPFKSEHSKK